MTDRDMSYDLDGVFSTRNQGQLISSTPVATKVTRTPGLAPVKIRPAYRPIKGAIEGMGRPLAEYVEAPNYSGGSLVDAALRGLGFVGEPGAEYNTPAWVKPVLIGGAVLLALKFMRS